MLETNNLLGAIVAIVIYVSAILVFVARLLDKPGWAFAAGVVHLLTALPLVYLLWTAPRLDRPVLYHVQVALMIVWLVVLLLVDYVFKVEFRGNLRWVIAFVVLFFAAAGGILGVAAQAGRGWTIAAVVVYLIMAVLAFVQRAVTGM